jgi:integrase
MQRVDDCKTTASQKVMPAAELLLERLKLWKATSQFSEAEDWIFASPVQLGRLPFSYSGTHQELTRASAAAGLGHACSHAFRHTYRSWLDALGTSVTVQQRMMWHTTAAMTLKYGEVVSNELNTVSQRIAAMAFAGNSTQTAHRTT